MINREIFSRIRDWVEPAHPAIIEQYEDLVAIYRWIREKVQPQLDEAFDGIARRIGFVVATTVPVVLEFGAEGKLKEVRMGGEHLKGTLFEDHFVKILSSTDPVPPSPRRIRAGAYPLYLIWFDALKLRLRADWVEPAHFRQDWLRERIRQLEPGSVVKPEVREPAHWFDPGIRLEAEDAILISVLDEVYPELRLAERVAFYRDFLRQVQIPPEVQEPAHFQPGQISPIETQRRIRRVK